MLKRAGFAGAGMLALMLHAAVASAQPAAPQAGREAAGFYPCSVAREESPEAGRCIASAMDAVQLVKARFWLITINPSAAGCIDKDAATCIATLSRTLMLSTSGYESAPFEIWVRPKLDINDKPINHSLSLRGSVPGGGVASVELDLGDGVHVRSIDFFLVKPPRLAQTEQEWNDTGVYDFAAAVLGPTCLGPNKLAFFRHYDALQRHGTTGEGFDHDLGDPGYSRGSLSVDHLCGVEMSISSSSGVSASMGSYSTSVLSFRHDDATSHRVPALAVAAATPTNPSGTSSAAPIAPELWQRIADDSAAKGDLGFAYVPSPMGAVVMAVSAKGPASAAGLRTGDLIKTIDGVSLEAMANDKAVIEAINRDKAPSVTLSVLGVGDVRVTRSH